MRNLAILLTACVGAAAVIFVVVLLTPLEDLPEPEGLVARGDGIGDDSDLVVARADREQPNSQDALGDSRSEGPAAGAFSPPLAAWAKNIEPFEQVDLLAEQPINADDLTAELKSVAASAAEVYAGNPAALHFAAQIYIELKSTEEAEAVWRACLSQHPTAAGPYAGLANLLIEQGREKAALEVLQQAQGYAVSNLEMILAEAQAFENLGDLPAALTAILGAHPTFDEDPQVWLVQGRILSQRGDFEDAETALKRAAAGPRPTEPALVALASCLVRLGKKDEAKLVRDQLAELRKPKFQEDDAFQDQYDQSLSRIAQSMLLAFASLDASTGNFPAAFEKTKRVLQLRKSNLQAHMSLSSIYRAAGDMPSVFAVHQKLVVLQPKNLLNYMNLASVALQVGKPDFAEQTLRAASKVDPQGVLSQAALARLLSANGQHAEARLLAAQVLERNQSVESHLLMAQIYAAAGDVTSQQAILTKAKELAPADPRLQQPMMLQVPSDQPNPGMPAAGLPSVQQDAGASALGSGP